MAKLDTKVTLKIPRQLYDNLQDIIKDSGFHSVTDFVVYCLRDVVYTTKQSREQGLTNKELDGVRERLKSLGYLE